MNMVSIFDIEGDLPRLRSRANETGSKASDQRGIRDAQANNRNSKELIKKIRSPTRA